MIQTLDACLAKGIHLGIVSGSDIVKVEEQVGKDLIEKCVDAHYKNTPFVYPTTENSPAPALSLDSYKNKCKDLGFKQGTQEFGKCVLQLSK
jgi:hypothetical protein